MKFLSLNSFWGAVKERQISRKMPSIRVIEASFVSLTIFVNSLKITKNYVLRLQEEIKLITEMFKMEADG